jgi:hypothetical protein
MPESDKFAYVSDIVIKENLSTVKEPSPFQSNSKKVKLEEDQTFTVIDLGKGTILLTPKVSQVDKLANQIAEKFKDEGITLEDLLLALNELRKTYNRS